MWFVCHIVMFIIALTTFACTTADSATAASDFDNNTITTAAAFASTDVAFLDHVAWIDSMFAWFYTNIIIMIIFSML